MKKILLVLLVTAILVLSGCSSGTNGKKSGFDLGSSFKGGDEGLFISFDEGLPPTSIKDQGLQPFNIRVSVENRGEFDIFENSTFVKLNGFDPNDLSLTETSRLVPPITSYKKQGNTEKPGGKQAVMFTNLKYDNSVVSGSYGISINANVCYPYGTQSIAEVCISGNTIPSVDDKYQNCNIEESKKFANSGAPVKIENVKQFSNGQSSIQIQFDIVHSGKSPFGTVFAPDSTDSNCNVNGVSPTSYEAINFKDRVDYRVISGIEGLNCEGTGNDFNSVLLTNGRYTVTCTQDTTGQGEAYNKLIEIKLGYNYLDRISKTISVEHIVR